MCCLTMHLVSKNVHFGFEFSNKICKNHANRIDKVLLGNMNYIMQIIIALFHKNN